MRSVVIASPSLAAIGQPDRDGTDDSTCGWDAMIIEREFGIVRPAQVVFDHLIDLANYPENPRPTRCTLAA